MSGGAKNDGEISEISEISEKNLEDMYLNTYYHKKWLMKLNNI